MLLLTCPTAAMTATNTTATTETLHLISVVSVHYNFIFGSSHPTRPARTQTRSTENSFDDDDDNRRRRRRAFDITYTETTVTITGTITSIVIVEYCWTDCSLFGCWLVLFVLVALSCHWGILVVNCYFWLLLSFILLFIAGVIDTYCCCFIVSLPCNSQVISRNVRYFFV